MQFIIKKFQMFLIILILLNAMFVNKNIYEFIINQELIIKIFTLIALSLFIIKILVSEIKYFYFTKMNLLILFFISIMTASLIRSKVIMVSLQDYILFFCIL